MKKEFELTENQYRELLKACQPVPYLVANGVGPISPQETANNAWRNLGDELGFKYMTVEPIKGKSPRYFTAEAKETP